REELVALLRKSAPPAIEIGGHQPPDVRVVAAVRQFEHARGRLFALRFVAQPLPRRTAADRDQGEVMAVEQIDRFLLRRRYHRRETEGGRDFGGSFRDRLCGYDQDL